MKTQPATLAEITARARADIDAGRRAIQDSRVAAEAILAAPIPLAEAEARVPAAVAQAADQWLAGHRRALLQTINVNGHALGEASDHGDVALPFDVGDGLPFGALAAGDAALATRLLLGILRASYIGVTFTIPFAERPRRVAEAERTFAALQAADEARTDAAIAAGLVVEHRPEVVSRRENEAYAARRTTLLAEARAARAAGIPPQ